MKSYLPEHVRASLGVMLELAPGPVVLCCSSETTEKAPACYTTIQVLITDHSTEIPGAPRPLKDDPLDRPQCTTLPGHQLKEAPSWLDLLPRSRSPRCFRLLR